MMPCFQKVLVGVRNETKMMTKCGPTSCLACLSFCCKQVQGRPKLQAQKIDDDTLCYYVAVTWSGILRRLCM